MRLIRLLKNDIAREAGEWVDDGLISQSQAEKICQRYDVDYHQIQNRSFGYSVLMGLGFLFIGLSVITLLGANWDEIPRAVRMWGLIAVTMTTQGLALRLYLQGRTQAIGIFFLGNLFYGASIILIAQVYHLGEHMPDGVFWWALGCLPIGILTCSRLILLQSLALALIWFFIEAGMGFYPALFPLFFAGGLYVLYRGQQSVLLFLTVVASIAVWFEYSLAEYWRVGRYFDFHAGHVVVSVALFILAYTFSHWLHQRESVRARDYGAILALWSLRFGLVFMLVMGFEDPWRDLIRADWWHITSVLALVAGFSIAALLCAYITRRLIPVSGLVSCFWVLLLGVLNTTESGDAIYFQIASNLLLVALGIWLIVRGIHSGVSHYFFLGIASILLTAFMRYVDLIGDYIGGAILFAVFAALLLGAAKYWKSYQLKMHQPEEIKPGEQQS